jgi:LDH2 family malate/lactate/ureidoglycolate dehydrogenase
MQKLIAVSINVQALIAKQTMMNEMVAKVLRKIEKGLMASLRKYQVKEVVQKLGEEEKTLRPININDAVNGKIVLERRDLVAFMQGVFIRVGVREEIACLVANKLADNDAFGASTHGINRFMSYYVNKITGDAPTGTLEPNQMPEIVKVEGTQVVVEAKNGFGFVAMELASLVGAVVAEIYGSAQVFVRGSNHCGTGRNWVEGLAKQGFYAEWGTNTQLVVAPTNGADRTCGTDPFACAFPTEGILGFNVMGDVATCLRPFGILEVYAKRGKSLEKDVVCDRQGRSISDPKEAMAKVMSGEAFLALLGGTHEGSGSHKGLIWALRQGMLSSFGGAGVLEQLSGRLGEKNAPHGLGHYLWVVKVPDTHAFEQNFTKMGKAFNENTPLPDSEKPHLPGKLSCLRYNTATNKGIPIDVSELRAMKEIQEKLGLEVFEFGEGF